MSRTEELRDQGAPRLTGGNNAPFLKWPDAGGADYAYIEGHVSAKWSGKYGTNVTMVAEHGQGLRAVSGKEDDKTEMRVEANMELNVSLGYAVLKEAAERIVVGDIYHIAFVGWEKPKSGGKPYRMFEIYHVGSSEPDPEFTEEKLEDPDDLPF